MAIVTSVLNLSVRDNNIAAGQSPVRAGATVAEIGQPPLFYVVDWLPPDFGAVGQYALIASQQAAASGCEVHLIGLTSGEPSAESIANTNGRAGLLTVERVRARPYQKSNFLHRLIWSVLTNCLLIRRVFRNPAARGAAVRFTGSPPFMLYFALPLKLLSGCRLIYRITDFYPEAIIAHLGRRSLFLRLLERMTWRVRRCVDLFEVIGEDQRALLLNGGIPAERIIVRRDTAPVAITGGETPLPRPAILEGRKILLYSGNYGVAHDVETVVQGFVRYSRGGSDRFGLWLNASGDNADVVMRSLTEIGIPVAKTPLVPLEELPALLAAADAHLIALRSEFSGIVLPSKVYGCILSRRPILFVGPKSSDVHLLCADIQQPYFQVSPGDAEGFAQALERLSA
jgi:hypothetical protein